MNITPINCRKESFKGLVTVNNLKTGVVNKVVTDAQTDTLLLNKFMSIANNRIVEVPSASKCLEQLKGCVKFYADTLKNKPVKELEMPAADKYSASYLRENGKSVIESPNFKITHEFKEPKE